MVAWRALRVVLVRAEGGKNEGISILLKKNKNKRNKKPQALTRRFLEPGWARAVCGVLLAAAWQLNINIFVFN